MRTIALFAALSLTGCATMAVWTAPNKTASTVHTPKAEAANDQFWQTFHLGRYDEIPQALDALTAAYLEDPNDARTAAHIGFLHIWRLSERARVDSESATATDDIMLAHKYFSEAVRLAPDDVRYQGFLAGMEMAEGTIHKDEKLVRRGYFDMMDAKDAWPEFNLFTAGYPMSRFPVDDPKFTEGLEYQWETLDRCADETVDRKTGDFSKYMSKETTSGRKRVCWNSAIAPHNFEGFFLNMGDMIVKQGNPETARHVYAQAKLSKTYAAWPYRSVLEDRITQANENVAIFRNPPKHEKVRTLMIHSAYSCMGCHQATE